MLTFMGGMLGQETRLKACLLALAYGNACPYVFSFIVFVCLAFLGKEMGVVVGSALCHMVCLVR